MGRVKARRYQHINKTTGEVSNVEEHEVIDDDKLPVKAPYVFYSQRNDWFSQVGRSAWGVALLSLHLMEGGGRVQLTQQEVADILKMSRVTVNKAIKQLEAVGFIKRLRFGYLVDETKVLKKLRSRPHRLAGDSIHHTCEPLSKSNAAS